jgi:DNA-binding SARP family transcriptional activator
MADLKLYLFGAPRLERRGQLIPLERRKALALAAYLALSEERQSRETLATLLWPELDHEHARAALRSTLSTMTTASQLAWIEADRTGVALKPDAVWVDAAEFISLLTQTRAHGHGPEALCDVCAEAMQQALALYRGEFLAGFSVGDGAEYDDWQTVQREWLRREYTGTLRRLAAHNQATNHLDEALDYAHQWLAVDGLNEQAHRMLMRLFLANGQRAEAIRQYQQCVKLLEAELATLPEEETVQLFQEIQGSRAHPVNGAQSAAPGRVGVRPPLPPLMLGRDEAIQDIVERLGAGGREMRSLTVIQGWPGVGKSTLAARLAHHEAIPDLFPDGVLWASLGETPNVLKELGTWAEALHVREAPRSRQIEDMSAQLAAVLHDKRVLFILDDVWKVEHMIPFRVGGPGCATVLTTRLNDLAATLAPTAQDMFRLPVLDESAGLALLSKLAPEIVTSQPHEARALVRDLEGLPLAIQVAGRLLHTEARLGWGITELLAELRAGAPLLAAHAPGDMLVHGFETSPTIATLLRRSTDLLDADARWRFALLGLFVPKPAMFDLKAMAAAWDVEDPKPTARSLVNRGLLEPISGGYFQMHALLIAHARSMLNAAAAP